MIQNERNTSRHFIILQPLNSAFGRITIDQNETIFLGRNKELPQCCRFKDTRISIEHCKIVVNDDKIIVYDTRFVHLLKLTMISTNGTFINGKKIGKGNERILKEGDVLSLVTPRPEICATEFPSYKVELCEEAENDESTEDFEQSTQEFEIPEENEEPKMDKKRKREELEEDVPEKKRKKSNDELSQNELKGSEKKDKIDPIVQELICPICQGIFYKCVTCLPCCHLLCAPCLSDWLQNNQTCPICRSDIDLVKKNFNICNLVDSYLQLHPEKRRSEEEMKRLDEKSEIDFVPHRPDEERCRECRVAGQDGFKCAINQRHVECRACGTLMPLRYNLPSDRTQQCNYCGFYFCQKYFGGCRGNEELKKLQEFEMTSIPFTCFGNNRVERTILVNYLNTNNIFAQEVYTTICLKLESVEYPNSIDMNAFYCNDCAQKIFSDFIYFYRKAIPKDRLPPEVANRPDCWYGRECRTQFHKYEHARKLNHVCERTR